MISLSPMVKDGWSPEADQRVRGCFATAASGYDRHARLQRSVGEDFLTRLPALEGGARILDVGMGTGILTAELARTYPQAEVVGVDYADGMTAAARHRGLSVIQADARALPFRDQVFDLVVSNLAYQWVDDIERAFEEAARILVPEGVFAFTSFGDGTVAELLTSVEEAMAQGGRRPVRPLRRLLPAARFPAALKKAGFTVRHTRSRTIRQAFPDIWALLRWLKAIGAHGLNAGLPLGRATLSRAGAVYQERFACPGGLSATFEIEECHALRQG